MYDKLILILIIILTCVILLAMYYSYQHHPLKDTNIESFTTVQEAQSNYDNYLNLVNLINQLAANVKEITGSTQVFLQDNPIYDPAVSYNNYKNINDNIASYTDKTADAQFYIDQIVKEQKLLMLEKQLEDLSSNTNLPTISPDSNKVYSIKNPYSGVNLNTEPLTASGNGSRGLVYLNGKCIGFDKAGAYSLKDCRADDPSQTFNTSMISTYADYNATIPDSLARFRLDSSDEFANISAFNIVTPSSDKSSCLTISNGNISIEPCNLTVFQRWNTSSKNLPC